MDIKVLQKTLKERTSECDLLKKKLEKFERDRQQWENQKKALESKQPMDVQMLQSQKRELTMQLDREQSEKQELFLQINSLIAQLADTNRSALDQQTSNRLEAENNALKKQLVEIQNIQAQLNSDVNNLHDELRHKSNEVENARSEVKHVQENSNVDRDRLQSSIDELQRDLQMKSAALQSLMLAKQETKANEADRLAIARLTAEKTELLAKVDELQKEMDKRLQEFEAQNEIKQNKFADVQREMDLMRLSIETNENNAAQRNSRRTHEIEQEVEKHRKESENLREQLNESHKILFELKEKYEQLKNDNSEQWNTEHGKLKLKIDNFEADMRDRLAEIAQLKNTIEKKELSARSAELEVKTYRQKITDLQNEINTLKMNEKGSQRGKENEVKKLREELEHARRRIIDQSADLEKAETDADEAEKSYRETIGELEEEIIALNDKLQAAERQEETKRGQLLVVEAEKTRVEEESSAYSMRCDRLSKELEEVQASLAESKASARRFEIENEKLRLKASLEDEVLTLATSLQSAHDENSAKQMEITKMRQKLRELGTENAKLTASSEAEIEELQEALQKANDKIAEYEKAENQVNALHIEAEKSEERQSAILLNDTELKYQKNLLEIRQQYEQRVVDLENELSRLNDQQVNKINDLNTIVTTYTNDLHTVTANLPQQQASNSNYSAEFLKQQNAGLLSPYDGVAEKYIEHEEERQITKEDCNIAASFDRQKAFANLELNLAILKDRICDVKSITESSNSGARNQMHSISERTQVIYDDKSESDVSKRFTDSVMKLRNVATMIDDDDLTAAEDQLKIDKMKRELTRLKQKIADEEKDRKQLKKYILNLINSKFESEQVVEQMHMLKYDRERIDAPAEDDDNENNDDDKDNDANDRKHDSDKNADENDILLIMKIEAHIRQIDQQKSKLHNTNKELMKTLEEIRNENKSLANELRKKNEQIEEGERVMSANESVVNGLKKTISRLNIELDLLREETENIQTRSCKELRNLNNECDQLRQLNSSLNLELSKMSSNLMEQEGKINRRVDELELKNAALSEIIKNYDASENERMNSMQQLFTQVNELKNRLHAVSVENERLTLEAADRQQALERLSRESADDLKETKQKLSYAAAEGERLAGEVLKLKASSIEQSVDDKQRMQQLDDLRTKLECIQVEGQREIEKLKSDLEMKQKIIDELLAADQKAKEEISRLTKQLNCESRSIADLELANQKLMQELSLSQEEIMKSNHELENLRAKSESVDIIECKRKMSELMAENAHLASEILKEQNRDKEVSGSFVDGGEKIRTEFTELLNEREEIWRKREEALVEAQELERRKMDEEQDRKMRSRQEEWRRKANEDLMKLEKQIIKLQNENMELNLEKNRLIRRIQADDVRPNNKDEHKLEAIVESSQVPKKRALEATGDIINNLAELVDENKKLKADMEMQRRLIVVLRRKLQSQQQQT